MWPLLLATTCALLASCSISSTPADSDSTNQSSDGIVRVLDKNEPSTPANTPPSISASNEGKLASPVVSTTAPLVTTINDSTADEAARALLATLTIKQKIGQVFMVGFDNQADGEWLIGTYNVGSLILMSGNDIGSPLKGELDALQAAARTSNGSGLLVATDQEGGIVQRLKKDFPTLPSARDAASRPDLTAYAKSVSQDLLAIGVNMNLAPVLDVDYSSRSAIGNRAFATIPYTVFIATTQWLGGASQSGIISTLKHFPGLGSSKVDSHFDLPVVHKSAAELIAQDMLPFKENIEKGFAEAVMVGAVSFPKIEPSGLPASLSKTLIDILRTELGYDGLVMTDDSGMGALKKNYTDEQIVTLALNAGVDMVLCVSEVGPPSCTREQFISMYGALEKAIRSGAVSQDALDRAVLRVLRLKAKHGLL